MISHIDVWISNLFGRCKDLKTQNEKQFYNDSFVKYIFGPNLLAYLHGTETFFHPPPFTGPSDSLKGFLIHRTPSLVMQMNLLARRQLGADGSVMTH